MKKGAWEMENLGMILLGLVLLFILIATVIILREKGIDLIGKLKEILLFR